MDFQKKVIFGENGRARIEQHFERNMMIERICDDYLEIYKKRVENSIKIVK